MRFHRLPANFGEVGVEAEQFLDDTKQLIQISERKITLLKDLRVAILFNEAKKNMGNNTHDAMLEFETPAQVYQLKRRYDQAVENGEEQFTFQGHQLLTSYAKYMLEYLADRIKKHTNG